MTKVTESKPKHKLWQTIVSFEQQKKELDKKCSELYNQKFALDQLVHTAKQTILLQEKHLSRLQWEAYYDQGDVYLFSYLENTKDPLIKLIVDPNWGRGSLQLQDGIEVGIKDNQVTLNFSEPNKVLSFISGHNLNVDTSKLDEKIVELRERVKTLEEARERTRHHAKRTK